MRKYLLLIFLSASGAISAQHWLQPGATYNYYQQRHTNYDYKQLKYTKDTVIDGKACSKIEYDRQSCYSGFGCGVVLDQAAYYAHKRNDSVFLLSPGIERYLFDLDPSVGDIWDYGPAPAGTTYPCNSNSQTFVDSIRVDTIHGLPVRKIFVHALPGSHLGYNGYITDRYGPAQSFLDYQDMALCSPGPTVSPWGQGLTCYSDSSYPAATFCQSPFQSPVGTKDVSQKKHFSMYPNPSHDQIIIELKNSGNGNHRIRIYNTMAQQIKKQEFESEDQPFRMNINDLSPGVYILELETETGREWVKFMKE